LLSEEVVCAAAAIMVCSSIDVDKTHLIYNKQDNEDDSSNSQNENIEIYPQFHKMKCGIKMLASMGNNQKWPVYTSFDTALT
jgi:hypothetical protein